MKLCAIIITTFFCINSMAISYYYYNQSLQPGGGEYLQEPYAGYRSGSITSLALASTALGSSGVAALVLLADNQAHSLNLNSQDTLDLIEEIQMDLEAGNELNQTQKMVLDIGVNAGQMDNSANLL